MWRSGNLRDDDRQPTDRQNQLLKDLPLAHVRGVMTEDPKNTDLEKILFRYWKLLASLHKPKAKRSTAIDRFWTAFPALSTSVHYQ